MKLKMVEVEVFMRLHPVRTYLDSIATPHYLGVHLWLVHASFLVHAIKHMHKMKVH